LTASLRLRVLGPQADLAGCLDLVKANRPTLIVAQCDSGNARHIRALTEDVQQRWPVPAIIRCEPEQARSIARSAHAGRVLVLSEPVDPSTLRSAIENMIELRSKERCLYVCEQITDAIFEGILDALIHVDAEGRILRCSPQASGWWNVDEHHLIGERFEDALPMRHPDTGVPIDDFLSYLEPVLSGLERLRVAFIRSPDGDERFIEATGVVLRDASGSRSGYIVKLHDFSRRHRLESSLERAEKIGTIGQLAGGIAHDFNNLLGVISAYAELITTQMAPDHFAHRYADNIISSVQKASKLIRTFNTISHPSRETTVAVVDLRQLTEEILELIRRVLGRRIEVVYQCGEGDFPLLVDPTHVERMLVNLCLNAKDAMSGTGTIRVTLERVTLDTEQRSIVSVIPPGQYFKLAVEDDGCGISESKQRRIFEPFYTTKGTKGTGLGLSSVDATIKRYKGYIDLRSEVGQGTTFILYFPVVDVTEVVAARRA